VRIPFTDRHLRLYATPVGDLAEPKGGVTGGDQESMYDGIWASTSESNPIFKSRLRWRVYNEMRTDPMIRAILWLYKLPLRSATWDLPPVGGGKDPVDRAVSLAAKWQFGIGAEGQLSISWDEWLTQRLLCIDWGSVFEEKIWAEELDWWRDPTANDQLRPMRTLARMGLRRPSSISRIKWDENTGQFERVWQDLPGQFRSADEGIPGEKVAHYAIERDGEFDWMGTSILRSMYGVWRMKNALIVSSGVAWDRWASGVVISRYPQGGGAEKERRATKIGENIRSHERGYVAYEGTAEQGWDLNILRGDPADPVNLLRHYDSQMATAALTMFSQLGVTERGSRAVGETLADPYNLAVKAIGGQVALDSTRDVLREWVGVNFGWNVDVPQFTIRKISSRSVESVVNALSLLAGAGYNIRRVELLNSVLEMLDLDKIPVDEETGEPIDEEDVVAEGESAFPGATPTGTRARRPVVRRSFSENGPGRR
jgi:hypothetical protein